MEADVAQISDLIKDFDWAIVYKCYASDECEKMKPFIEADMAVYRMESKTVDMTVDRRQT